MEVVLERNAFLALTLLAALSCSEEEPSVEGETTTPITDLSTGALCPEDSKLTWDSFGKDFMSKYCVRCHSSELMGAERLAPPGSNFDELSSVRSLVHQIDRQAAAGPKGNHVGMPPSDPYPAMDQREKLGHWLACGAPGGAKTGTGTGEAGYSLQLQAAGSAALP